LPDQVVVRFSALRAAFSVAGDQLLVIYLQEAAAGTADRTSDGRS
jgi:hypothetical protein